MVWTISLFFIAVGISAQAQIERMMVAIRLSEFSRVIQPFFEMYCVDCYGKCQDLCGF